jgi:hypothetical protein
LESDGQALPLVPSPYFSDHPISCAFSTNCRILFSAKYCFGIVYLGDFSYFVVCLPITANWIWPRYGTPYEIIILIVAMYLSLGAGIICIRWYKYLNSGNDVGYRTVDGKSTVNIVDEQIGRRSDERN